MANLLFGWALATLAQAGGFAPSSPQATAWERISRSIVLIEARGKKIGVAAMIDRKGLFLTHKAALDPAGISGRLADGKLIFLTVEAIDEPTQLALLRAEGELGDMTPIEVGRGDRMKGQPLIAALTSGPVRGEFVAAGRTGIIKPSLRYVPLSEIRLETPRDRLGGALTFSLEAKLVGVLGATLEPVSGGNMLTQNAASAVQSATRQMAQAPQFGPRGLTISYSLGTDVLQRVVDGFRSPSHKVLHPSIGAFFSDSKGKGALIREVVPNSPAAKAGIRVGDLVTSVDAEPVWNHIELAALLFRREVGSTVKIGLRRGDETLEVQVTVGSA